MSKDEKKKKREDLEDIEERLEDDLEEELEDHIEDLEEDIEELVEENKQELVPKEELVKLKYQFSEFVNKYKEYDKEFENYKRRTREEIKAAKEEGIAKAVKAIFPALDNFKKAKMLITDKSSLSGINLIEKSLLTELEKLGVKPIKAKGEKFDPEYHNAVMLVENESIPSGTVVEEYETGYTLGDKVIKFSQVTVSK